MERKEAMEVVKNHMPHSSFKILHEALETLIPELKGTEEERDERIREEIIQYIKDLNKTGNLESKYSIDWIAWLETQDRQMVARGERKNLALSLMDYLDNNRVEGCMDLSSMECEDLENAVVNSDWGKVYRYMRKKLEKQDKQNSNYYIHITQKIIDYIKANFTHIEFIPKPGDVWKIYPGYRSVVLKNDKGDLIYNLPLHVVDLDSITPDPSSDWKPADKVEPKFIVGDWVVQRDLSDFYSGDKFAQITNIDDEGNYWLDCGTWITGREIRLWTIHDAKDGDVLVSPYQRGIEDKEDIFIFKCIGNRGYIDNCIEYYCNVDEGEFHVNKTSYMGTTSFPLYPATEKQRDLLFAKMKKAGYKWDDEKKQILRIDNSRNTIEK